MSRTITTMSHHNVTHYNHNVTHCNHNVTSQCHITMSRTVITMSHHNVTHCNHNVTSQCHTGRWSRVRFNVLPNTYRSYHGNATLNYNHNTFVTSVTVTHAKSWNNKKVIIICTYVIFLSTITDCMNCYTVQFSLQFCTFFHYQVRTPYYMMRL